VLKIRKPQLVQENTMKLFALTCALTVAASSAFAGALAFDAPVLPEMIVEETGSMGGSGLWLIPLLAIALIFLVMKDGGRDPCGRTVDVKALC
jgi:hypothetical protein